MFSTVYGYFFILMPGLNALAGYTFAFECQHLGKDTVTIVSTKLML